MACTLLLRSSLQTTVAGRVVRETLLRRMLRRTFTFGIIRAGPRTAAPRCSADRSRAARARALKNQARLCDLPREPVLRLLLRLVPRVRESGDDLRADAGLSPIRPAGQPVG